MSSAVKILQFDHFTNVQNDIASEHFFVVFPRIQLFKRETIPLRNAVSICHASSKLKRNNHKSVLISMKRKIFIFVLCCAFILFSTQSGENFVSEWIALFKFSINSVIKIVDKAAQKRCVSSVVTPPWARVYHDLRKLNFLEE